MTHAQIEKKPETSLGFKNLYHLREVRFSATDLTNGNYIRNLQSEGLWLILI